MENFQGIHASVITALRCSKTRVWNSAGPQIFSRTPELHTQNSAGLRTLDWNAITWQNSRPGIPPDSRTLIPESAGLQNSEPGIHRNPEFRVSVTRNSGGLRPESKLDLEFRWNSAGIPDLFLLGLDSRLNWNLEMLVFEEGGKTGGPRENPRSKDENQ